VSEIFVPKIIKIC